MWNLTNRNEMTHKHCGKKYRIECQGKMFHLCSNCEWLAARAKRREQSCRYLVAYAKGSLLTCTQIHFALENSATDIQMLSLENTSLLTNCISSQSHFYTSSTFWIQLHIKNYRKPRKLFMLNKNSTRDSSVEADARNNKIPEEASSWTADGGDKQQVPSRPPHVLTSATRPWCVQRWFSGQRPSRNSHFCTVATPGSLSQGWVHMQHMFWQLASLISWHLALHYG